MGSPTSSTRSISNKPGDTEAELSLLRLVMVPLRLQTNIEMKLYFKIKLFPFSLISTHF